MDTHPVIDDKKMHWQAFTQTDIGEMCGLPKKYGSALSSALPLRQGVTLSLDQFHVNKPLVIDIPENTRPLEFCFALSGEIVCHLKGFPQPFNVSAGRCNLCFINGPIGRVEYKCGTPIKFLTISIDPKFLGNYLDDRHIHGPLAIQRLAKGQEDRFFRDSVITSEMKMGIHQILNCPYDCSIGKLYLESKAMELVAHLLAALGQAEGGQSYGCVFSPPDIQRIHEAGRYLTDNLQDPPSLVELARQVNLNDCKLKAGFRKVFGMSAFNYLRRCRMDRARYLLESAEMNVTEAATTVGYSNISHFAVAFKRQFGVNPGALLSESRKRISY